MDSDNSILNDEVKRVLKSKFLTLKDDWLLSIENDETKISCEKSDKKNDNSDDEEDGRDEISKKSNSKKTTAQQKADKKSEISKHDKKKGKKNSDGLTTSENKNVEKIIYLSLSNALSISYEITALTLGTILHIFGTDSDIYFIYFVSISPSPYLFHETTFLGYFYPFHFLTTLLFRFTSFLDAPYYIRSNLFHLSFLFFL